MKKFLIFLVFIAGCAAKITPKQMVTDAEGRTTMWYEAKEWEVLNVREAMTPEEIKRCQAWNYTYRIATIRNGTEVKEIVIRR